MISSILSKTASSKLLGLEVVKMSIIFPKVPVILRRTFKQSREYPEDNNDVPSFLCNFSAPALSDFVFALLPSADSASSMMMIPP